VHVHIVEGPYPIDGTWSFEPEGEGTRVRFVADGRLRGAARLAEPILGVMLGRQMTRCHANLRTRLETSEGQLKAGS